MITSASASVTPGWAKTQNCECVKNWQVKHNQCLPVNAASTHFAAALAWFVANLGSAWALGWFDPATYGGKKTGGTSAGVKMNGMTSANGDEMKSDTAPEPATAI